VAVVRVPVEVGRLVGAPEPRVVGGDAAVARVAYRRDHLAPQIRPGRLAVKEDHRSSLPLVQMREPQAVDLAVIRLVGEVQQPLEALVGGAKDVGHAAAILWDGELALTRRPSSPRRSATTSAGSPWCWRYVILTTR